jgi:hypothetical protein
MQKENSIQISKSSAFFSFVVADMHLEGQRDKFKVLDFWHYPIWDKLIRELRKIGFEVIPCPRIKKDHPILLPYNKYGRWKELEVDLQIYFTGFRLEFYQNINTGDRKQGDGKYAYTKYDLMPYLVKKKFDYTVARLGDLIADISGAAVNRTDPPEQATAAILKNCENNHWKLGNPTVLEDIAGLMKGYDIRHNSTDRDQKQIVCGEVKYFRHYNGRLYRGHVYHHINNMWWVRVNKYWYSNVAAFNLFDATPQDIEQRRLKENRMPEARKKELEFLHSLPAATLKKLLRRATKVKIVLIGLLFLNSCGPSRNANGHYWKATQVWRRMTAGKGNSILHQIQCPIWKK